MPWWGFGKKIMWWCSIAENRYVKKLNMTELGRMRPTETQIVDLILYVERGVDVQEDERKDKA